MNAEGDPMPIIKKPGAPGGGEKKRRAPAASAPSGNGVDARARAMIEDAEHAAEALLTETDAEVEKLVQDAAQAGQQEGFLAAENMRADLATLEERLLTEVGGEVVRAALRTAEELLRAERETRPETMVDIVATALGSAKDAREVRLRANPADVPILRQHQQRLLSAVGRAKEIDIREDRKVARGGVLIQTESGVIDAQLQTQLDELANLLGA
jgi:type III secretion protein L